MNWRSKLRETGAYLFIYLLFIYAVKGAKIELHF